MANKKISKTNSETAYTKEQILSSAEFSHRKDILGALIMDDEIITKSEAKNRLDKFMKGKVN